MQVQLVLPLDRGEPLVRVELVSQSADQGRLAGVLQPSDDDVLPRPKRGAEERDQTLIDHAETGQALEVDVADPVAAYHNLWAGRGPRHGRQPRPVVQPQVQPWMGRGEGPLGATGTRGQQLQQLDELVVGVRDRRPWFLAAIGVADPDLVAAVHLDVLHTRVVHQRLQPSQPEQRRHHRLGQRVLLIVRQSGLPGEDLLARPGVECVSDQVPRQLAAKFRITGRLRSQARRERVGDLTPQPTNHVVVHARFGLNNDQQRIRIGPRLRQWTGQVIEVPQACWLRHDATSAWPREGRRRVSPSVVPRPVSSCCTPASTLTCTSLASADADRISAERANRHDCAAPSERTSAAVGSHARPPTTGHPSAVAISAAS